MLTTRLVKVAMVASLALLGLLAAYGNLVDYGSNYEFVRHVLSMDTVLPCGGFKQSGIGREGGLAGLESFTESKTILLDARPAAR